MSSGNDGLEFSGHARSLNLSRLSIGTERPSVPRDGSQYFTPSTKKSERLETTKPSSVEWPNGAPPTGPKSQQYDISPPALRRSGDSLGYDSYRPSETSIQSDAYRSNKGGRRSSDWASDRRTSSDFYRPRTFHRMSPPAYGRRLDSDDSDDIYPRYSRPTPPVPRSPSNHSRASSVQHRQSRKSSLNGPIRQHQQQLQQELEAAKAEGVSTTYSSRGACEAALAAHNDTDDDPYSPRYSTPLSIVLTDAPNLQTIAPISTATTQQADANQSERHQAKIYTLGENILPGPIGLNFASIKKSRMQSDETSSLISDKTSSSKTSMKRKCVDCPINGSDLSPLFRCSTCPRRYHTCCGNPRPSTV